MNSTLSRRTFLGTSAALGAAAVMGIAGCSSPTAVSSTGGEPEATASDARINNAPESIAETYDVDVVIIGTGGSGAACLAQATENGLTALAIEKQDSIGGGTKGGIGAVFSLGDEYHEKAGLNIFTPAQLVSHELQTSQYRADGARWLKLVSESADTLQWVIDHGGAVWHYEEVTPEAMAEHAINVQSDFMMPPLFWKDASSLDNCIKPLIAAAESQGAEVLLDTEATSLIQAEDGTVIGLYAVGPNGGVQVSAKAVVLATGGFSANHELIAKAGWDLEETIDCNMGVETGDGYLFGLAAGAQDRIGEAAPMAQWAIEAFPGRTWNDPVQGDNGWTQLAKQILVNQNGERFMAEDVPLANPIMQVLPTKNNQKTYTIFNDAIFAEHFAQVPDAQDQLEKALADNLGDSFYRCDTIEECAEKFGIDAAQLAATLADYNRYCENGLDEQFLKSDDYLEKIEGPFYIGHIKNGMQVYIGGLNTSDKFEVLDDAYEPIPGLYATGVDGCTLYRSCYTVAIGSGTFAHSLWSGRKAADAIAEHMAG
ncbi:FAD-dependent oxidoreductase [Adlercreutzia equolifaciens]|uniref:FAD-dependent oxidoreductase n=1 Tax=Adlercreutzia equolifaciens TaxID=446660 RepID=UPI003AEF9C1C